MEQAPPFLEHPPRYVPLPHHLPPPNHSEDLNFYPRLLPPPRPLSPPPPPSFHSDHQLLFPFSNHPSPIEDYLRIPPHHHLLPPPPQPPPRVFDPNFDNSFPMSRSDSSWTEPPRVPPRNLIQFDHPTRHVLDSRLRFRDDFIDDVGFKLDHGGEEFLRNSTHVVDTSNGSRRYDVYDSHSPGSSWNFGFVNSHFCSPNKKSREYGSTVESYQSFRGFTMDNDRVRSNGSDENRRWVGHAWPPARSSSDACPVDGENKAFDNSNVLQAGFSRRVPHVYDYGKFRASREGNEEFHQSRRKEIERTSALRRIQVRKSAKRNRNGEQKFSRLCSIDSGPSTSGSRGPVAHTDNRVQPDREGSPVELDVSFKSNALVAKAIVASPSCRVISNKKLFRPELDHSNSTRNKSNSSADGFDRPVVSDKKSNHSGGSIKDLGGRDLCDIFSQPPSHHTVELPRRNMMKEPVSDKFIDTVGSVGTSLLRLKKKKVNSYALRSPMMEKNVDLIKQDRSISGPPAASQVGENSMHSREKSAPPGMVLLHNVDMQPSPREVTAFLDHIIENYTTGYVVSDKDGTEIDSGGSHVQNSKTTRNSTTRPFGSSNCLKINVDEGYEIADASINMPTISFYAKGPAELQNGSAFTGSSQVDDFGHKIEPPVFLQNDFLKGQLEANKIYSPEEIKSDGVPVNLLTTVHNSSISDNGLIRGQLKITVSDTDAVDTDSKFNEATVLAESVDVEGFPRAVPLVESKVVVGLSNAEETSIQEDASDRYSSNDSATTTSGSDNGSKNYQSKSSFCGVGYLDDTGKESEDSATVLPDNVAFEGAPKATMLVRGDPHAGFEKGCTSNKRKDTSHNLPSPSSGDMSENPAGTTLSFPATELNFAEEYVLGAQSFSAGSQCCTDKDRIECGSSPIKGSVDNDVSGKGSIRTSQNATSPKYMKKRKISAPFFPLPMLSETQEGSSNAGTFTSSVELPSLRDMVCSIHQEGSSGLPSSSESCPLLLEDFKAGISFEGVGFLEESLRNNVSQLEQNENGELVMTIENVFGKEKVGRGKSVEEPGVLQIDSIQQRNLVEIQTLDRDRSLPLEDVECEADLLVKNGLPPVSYPLSLYGHDDGVSSFDLHDTAIESARDKLFVMDAEGTPSTATASKIVNTEIKIGQEPNDKIYMHERKQDESLVLEDLFSSNLLKTSPQNTTTNNKPGRAVGSISSINTKVGPQDARKTIHGLNSVTWEITKRKNQLASVVPSISPGHLSKKTAPSSHRTKPRTWHRSTNPSASSHQGKSSYSNPFPPQRQQATNIGKDQTAAYIRKGNSLVRKPSPSATSTVSHGLTSSVYRLYPTTVNEIKEKTGLVPTLERPKTPPLPCSTKLSNCMTSSPLADPPPNGCSETNSDSLAQNINEDVLKVSYDAPNSTGTSEYQNGQINNSVGQIVQDDRNSVSRELKKIVYVKRKSNQLVAASGSRDVSHQNVDKTENPSSNGYYKRRKNQIIRESFKITQKVGLPSDLLILEEKNCLPVIGSSSSGRQSGKGLEKTYKPSKSSLVWTLCGTESLKKENRLIHQVCPHLFPWKRATYRRSLMHISASVPSNTSLSTISQKLLLSRKRETIYTRSTQGFSLRKSKVLSIGGASLKWSKSIERKLKKANEEATLAVVAVDKKKREQNVAGAVTAGEKNRNCSSRKLVHSVELCPGERVFRVGSVRYKMDLTRRTLQRISDEESTNSAALQPGAKKSSVPKRLLIGTNEYVRIGNGNQLIRDPRKRTRILASEKVRWSLHNARLRLARKRKYCQFFTRFGKCNKDDGKCPYIHDSSKIVVCTKFLKGSCSDINCKLTHKAIPERMQDCSYFLQGLCTNENCPYRHVNVNPNASICEGFLRGYCADGNECQKKHSYVCPSFEATGTCTQGSKCKLHHPKKQNKGRKTDTSKEQKNTRGRYFGSKHIDILDSRTAVSGRHSAKDSDDIFSSEGRFADYIDLGLLDEEVAETNELVGKETTTASSYDGRMEMHEDKEELIKPVNLMSRSMK